MSLNLRRKIILSSLVTAALVGLAGLHAGSDQKAVAGKSAKFRPASLQVSKTDVALEASIEVGDGFPETNDQAAHLRATLHPQIAEGSWIDYRWVFPDGVALKSGNSEGQVQAPADGEDLNLDIFVVGFSSEGGVRNINLQMSLPGKGVGNTAIISSHPTRSDLSRGYRGAKTGRTLDPAVPAEQSKPRLPAGVKL